MNSGLPFDPEGVIALSIGFGICVVVPIVAMLLAHQRKMAEVVRKQQTDPMLIQHIQHLQNQIDQLRDRLNERILAQDSARSVPPSFEEGQARTPAPTAEPD
jgi:hypothetical protein